MDRLEDEQKAEGKQKLFARLKVFLSGSQDPLLPTITLPPTNTSSLDFAQSHLRGCAHGIANFFVPRSAAPSPPMPRSPESYTSCFAFSRELGLAIDAVVTASPAICSTDLRTPAQWKGNCLVCLASIGLDEADGGAAIQPGQLVFGDFEIEWHADGSPVELGHGAMGITYRAEDQVLEREVALKVIELPAESSGAQATRERFLRGARCGAFRHQT